MKAMLIFAFAVVALSLSACSSVPVFPYTRGKPEQKLDCRSQEKCEVQVTVSCLLGCAISVDNYAVIISKKGGKNRIVWQLPLDSSFAFASDDQGVVFDADGAKVFKCKTGEGGRRVDCTTSDENFGVYKYTVNVVGFLLSLSLDPWVINN